MDTTILGSYISLGFSVAFIVGMCCWGIVTVINTVHQLVS